MQMSSISALSLLVYNTEYLRKTLLREDVISFPKTPSASPVPPPSVSLSASGKLLSTWSVAQRENVS